MIEHTLSVVALEEDVIAEYKCRKWHPSGWSKVWDGLRAKKAVIEAPVTDRAQRTLSVMKSGMKG